MLSKMSVLVCKDAQEAARAKSFLEGGGFPAGKVEIVEVGNFSYDGKTYTGHGSTDLHRGVFVVIGRA